MNPSSRCSLSNVITGMANLLVCQVLPEYLLCQTVFDKWKENEIMSACSFNLALEMQKVFAAAEGVQVRIRAEILGVLETSRSRLTQ
jgi:hypothetical protein